MAEIKAENLAEPAGDAITLRQKAYRGISEDADPRFSDDAAVLWRITKLVLRYRLRFAIAVGATVAAAMFQLMIPRFLGGAVDSAMGLLTGGAVAAAAARESLFEAALLLLGASILRGVFTLAHNYGGEAIGHLIAYDLRLAFYRKLQSLSFSFHDRIHTGELITRGMLDLEGVRMFVNTGLLRLVLLIILIGAGAYLLLSTDLLLGLLSFSFVPFVAWRSSTARLRLRALWLALQERMGVLGQIMDENLAGIRVVRAFGAEPFEIDKFDTASDDAMTIADERIKTRAASTSVMTFAYFIAMGLVLWVGGMRVLEGAMTVGVLTMFLTFITILQQPVRQLGLLVNSLARASTCGARLFSVLDLEPEISDRAGAKTLEPTMGTVRFEDVSFAYAGPDAPPVLHNVSFSVARGQTLGIVGPPGSGKTTIANLLPRYYDPSEGRITIDGQDLRDATLASLRQVVRVVQQDAFLFTASLENNIAYGDPWADDGMIQDAASAAQIDGFVAALPEGYGTLVGERGVSLSGGQKQRVAIARSAMLQSSVLVLDDSTAAIDAETEQRIREALKGHMENCATIIISHRLGALRHADEIIFLEAGNVVERGNHDSLLAQGGRYAALFALQSHDDAGDVGDADNAGAAQ
ncbi:MAG: ABC transporter ATP-binding protein [Rhodospirillaceae bacterium]|nr:ABC transporter ATP-binding protein [Rhodospirillaceae bacterium]MBT3779219.1 ABC transporter ATP-binding protein [Rhodospirillaceae bacterium]MBT3979668.1 ABC transporter ATP-binding protein [Rhodospirillaceae bacterium]MBT4561925.1 ABC transporter ATP-binding protein [Rhodospirillaceae bacterium]MBT4742975.1 ABC transporter ATP-binding protein [Rhodospirillaceae bacterium]